MAEQTTPATTTPPQVAGLFPIVDSEAIFPLLECSWWECKSETKLRLYKAAGLLRSYIAERKVITWGAGIGGFAIGVLVGFMAGALRR